jgi:uncharacterized protein (TIGR00730 family)
MSKIQTICVYCGSSTGVRASYAAAARELGEAMARAGLRLIYGGGCVGLMGILADAVLAAGGEAIGVIPRWLVEREVAHLGLTELRVVETMHERKFEMAKCADAFLALPGGYGTLDEMCEVLGWSQLGLNSKPVMLLDVDDYWSPMFGVLDHAVREGFIKPKHRAKAQRASSVAEAMEMLQEV